MSMKVSTKWLDDLVGKVWIGTTHVGTVVKLEDRCAYSVETNLSQVLEMLPSLPTAPTVELAIHNLTSEVIRNSVKRNRTAE